METYLIVIISLLTLYIPVKIGWHINDKRELELEEELRGVSLRKVIK